MLYILYGRQNLKKTNYMKRILLLALILVALTGCMNRTPKLSPLAHDAVVLAFGDSLTFGTGAPVGQSYPAVLQALIGRNIIASGVPGEVTADGRIRLQEALDEHHPRLLILCHGGNDFLRHFSEHQTAENIRAMIQMAQASGAEVVVIAVPKPGLLPTPPELYEQISKEFNIPLDDSTLKSILTNNAEKSDMVHPNAQGYLRLAEAVATLLKNAGAI